MKCVHVTVVVVVVTMFLSNFLIFSFFKVVPLSLAKCLLFGFSDTITLAIQKEVLQMLLKVFPKFPAHISFNHP